MTHNTTPLALLDRLREDMGGSEELVVVVIETFLTEAPLQLQDIVDAAASGDCVRIARSAHRYKGALAATYAAAALEAAQNIELASKQGDLALAREQLTPLVERSNELTVYLQRWFSEQPAPSDPSRAK